MVTEEAIVLAGGLGTRLRSAVPDLPKCMAPVNGKPFIAYVTSYLQQQGIKKFIFALGYKSEAFDVFLKENFADDQYSISIEQEPLGTGGAIRLACEQVVQENVLITNGDTLFKIDVAALGAQHESATASCTLALKPMQHFERYGVVELDENSRVKRFREKQYYADGLINGGIYALNAKAFLHEPLPSRFSFEKDYLEKFYQARMICGVIQDAYFIDIGIPEDYQKAKEEIF